MPKFSVTLYYTGSVEYEVEADSEEEAVEEALAVNNQESDETFMAKMSGRLEYTNNAVVEEIKEGG